MAAAASEGSDALLDKQSEDEWENVPTAAEKEKTSRAACAHWCRLVQRTMKELETADKAIAQYFAKIAISTSSLPMAASASEGSAVGNRPFTAASPALPQPQQSPASPVFAYLIIRASSLSAPPCACYLCSTRQLEGRRPITGIHTGFGADGAALSGPSLWAKLQPYFVGVPGLSSTAIALLEEYSWCIEHWPSEEAACDAWPAAASRYGHADPEPPVHLWLEASSSQIELSLEAGATEIIRRLRIEL
jgi:hypothetical protein